MFLKYVDKSSHLLPSTHISVLAFDDRLGKFFEVEELVDGVVVDGDFGDALLALDLGSVIVEIHG